MLFILTFNNQNEKRLKQKKRLLSHFFSDVIISLTKNLLFFSNVYCFFLSFNIHISSRSIIFFYLFFLHIAFRNIKESF